ncbi:hypothetical protein Q760_17855 [Cellulomonas cellasea DSM 20118]|uniref:Uncharacterized protein n=1 Tax=Cellulomonas cellasea DSM 20118 TaxID=1408250 RepID=A0A0A0B691_9CELL|nr:hypothetical protein Q760_17855 [Cellulomonas cellasea DSM 20118]
MRAAPRTVVSSSAVKVDPRGPAVLAVDVGDPCATGRVSGVVPTT